MPDVPRVGIIGTDWVGSSPAISTLHAALRKNYRSMTHEWRLNQKR